MGDYPDNKKLGVRKEEERKNWCLESKNGLGELVEKTAGEEKAKMKM